MESFTFMKVKRLLMLVSVVDYPQYSKAGAKQLHRPIGRH